MFDQLAVMSFLPYYCSACGKPMNGTDWFEGASWQCGCGAMYQYATREAVLDAAKTTTGGDLSRYA